MQTLSLKQQQGSGAVRANHGQIFWWAGINNSIYLISSHGDPSGLKTKISSPSTLILIFDASQSLSQLLQSCSHSIDPSAWLSLTIKTCDFSRDFVVMDFLNSPNSSLQMCVSPLISIEIPTAQYLLLVVSWYNGVISFKSSKFCGNFA